MSDSAFPYEGSLCRMGDSRMDLSECACLAKLLILRPAVDSARERKRDCLIFNGCFRPHIEQGGGGGCGLPQRGRFQTVAGFSSAETIFPSASPFVLR
jgi:hypothetical protein